MGLVNSGLKNIALFDLGHSECRLLVIDIENKVFKTFQRPVSGYAKGKVTIPTEFSESVAALVGAAGLAATRYKAIVNISDLHTRYVSKSLHHRTSGTYGSSDYSAILESAVDSTSGELDEVIDSFVISSRLDDNPLNALSFGSTGRGVQFQVMLATHPKLILADILSGMNAGGVEVAEFRSSGFGLARALKYLRPDAENSVLIDLGHSSCSGAVLIGGHLQKVFSLPVGSHHINRDLIAGLDCAEDVAEVLKRTHGISAAEGASHKGNAKFMQRFLRPRILEILSLAGKNFAIYSRSLDGGLLLCGGGSLMPGLSALTGAALNCGAPFVCQLSNKSLEGYLGLSALNPLEHIGSSWLSLFSQGRAMLAEISALRAESDARPLSRLRPLWTWLSELSR
jgi:cell division ATPase FtsA